MSLPSVRKKLGYLSIGGSGEKGKGRVGWANVRGRRSLSEDMVNFTVRRRREAQGKHLKGKGQCVFSKSAHRKYSISSGKS